MLLCVVCHKIFNILVEGVRTNAWWCNFSIAGHVGVIYKTHVHVGSGMWKVLHYEALKLCRYYKQNMVSLHDVASLNYLWYRTDVFCKSTHWPLTINLQAFHRGLTTDTAGILQLKWIMYTLQLHMLPSVTNAKLRQIVCQHNEDWDNPITLNRPIYTQV